MRILVVEDEKKVARFIQQGLEEEHYAVDISHDGNEGLRMAQSGSYDVIVLDVMLPGKDGVAVTHELRSGRITTPILMLTAKTSTEDKVAGLDSGADDYLTKPFELAELFARLRAVIRRSAGKPNSVAHIGDVQIDTVRKCVSKDGQLVCLTPREYALVEFLTLHRGELVTRSMLYDHLFDEDDDSLSNLVDVHVSNVRKKLGKDFIVTRRGQGYLLEDGMPAMGSEANGEHADA